MIVIAKIRASAEAADEVAGLFTGMVAWVRDNEPGTLSYVCCRASNDPAQFVFFERYTDEAAFHAHSASERFMELVGQLKGKLDGGIEMEMLDEVAAKL
jgi:quinol monooxygenase YgiN